MNLPVPLTLLQDFILVFLYREFVCWFLYTPVNNFSVMQGLVFLGLTSTKQKIRCLAQGDNAVPPVRLEPGTPGIQ